MIDDPVKHYARRNTFVLGKFYTNHVMSMTEENLHSKNDIAAELAYRDAEIEKLKADLSVDMDVMKSYAAGIDQRDAEIAHLRKELLSIMHGAHHHSAWWASNVAREALEMKK